MHVQTYKTKKVHAGDKLTSILDTSLPVTIPEKSVVVITSKIVALCENRVVTARDLHTKNNLVPREADYYIEPQHNQYGFYLTIKNSVLVAQAGIDASNVGGKYVLWPKNAQKSAEIIWKYLRTKFKLHKLGIIITDSRLSPLRWGTSGIAIGYCGFSALNDYRGKPDIFGRPLKFTQTAVSDGLAASAVVVMGEGNEQTPLAVITDIPFVTFQARQPTKKELSDLLISLKQDVFSPFLNSPLWKKGKGGK